MIIEMKICWNEKIERDETTKYWKWWHNEK